MGRASVSSGGWKDITFDLTKVGDLGDLTGQPAVWVAIVFESDLDTTYEGGAFVDDIVLRAFAGGERPTPPVPPACTSSSCPSSSRASRSDKLLHRREVR